MVMMKQFQVEVQESEKEIDPVKNQDKIQKFHAKYGGRLVEHRAELSGEITRQETLKFKVGKARYRRSDMITVLDFPSRFLKIAYWLPR